MAEYITQFSVIKLFLQNTAKANRLTGGGGEYKKNIDALIKHIILLPSHLWNMVQDMWDHSYN